MGEIELKTCPKNCGVDLVRFHAASATCHWVECNCGWTGPKRANKKRAAEVWNAAALDAAEARAVGVQCCMCGKRDLSTVEGDGGTECELHDGRWVCSSDCYDRAVPDPATPASPLGAVVMREKAARIAEDRNDEIWDIYTGEKVGLDGCAEKIRAIPLPTDDELFAAAAELLAKHFASLSPEELGRFELAVEIDGAIAALAPFTRKGE